MTISQGIQLAEELQKISLDLLEVSMTTKDLEAAIKVGKANKKLCEIGKVLTDHLLEEVKEL